MYNNLKKYFSSLVFLIKILIIAGAYYVISDKLLNDGNFNSFLWQERFETLNVNSLSIIFLLLLLTIGNWFLEILKWKNLTSFVTNISFNEAAKQSLSSLTASLLTPNRIGEYGAKAIYFSKAFRPKILLLNFVGNAHQMFVTVLFGLFGLVVLREAFTYSYTHLIWITSTFLLLLGFLSILTYQYKWLQSFKPMINNFLKIPWSIHKTTFFYAAGRYLIFSHQFYLFLVFFGVDLSYGTAIAVIVSMYLISSVIPGFVIFDWLVKGSVAVTLFRLFGLNEMLVLSITGSMWLLNFALPAIVGSYYVLTFKSQKLVFSEPNIQK